MSERKAEDEYFAQIEREKRAKLQQQVSEEEAAKALSERKAAHWHRCGKCGGNMTSKLYRGQTVEVCDDCGAVLLDRGELELLAGADQSGILSGLSALFGRST